MQRFLFGTVLALMTLIAAACAAATPSTQPQPSAQQPDVAQALQAKQDLQCDAGKEHWRAQSAPKRGGVFKKAISAADAVHLDLTVPGPTIGPIPQVYRHLVKPRACFYEDTQMEPDLAKSWQVSPDGLTWTLKLRDDARWHSQTPVNGRALTSADVAWTIDLQQAGGQLRSYWELVGHEQPDLTTIVFRLKAPDADFLTKLGDSNNVMLPREVKEQLGDFKTKAIGTGPYVLREFKPGQGAVLDRNAEWKEQGPDGKPLPLIDEVQTVVFTDAAAEVAAVRAAQVDLNNTQGFDRPTFELLKQSNPKLIPYQDIAGSVWGIYLKIGRASCRERV